MGKRSDHAVDGIKLCNEFKACRLLSLMIMCGVETACDCMISASDQPIKRASAMSTVYPRAVTLYLLF